MILTDPGPGSKGYVFDIQGLSVHDGPGCRTLIFLKGCTLNCFWCSNPEGISSKPTLMYFSSKCIACGKCVNNCPQHAISLENGKINIFRQLCETCLEHTCTSECYTGALKLCGYEITVSKLLQIIKRDRQFWGSEGGITLTGGEPLLQLEFAKEILRKCHKIYIHTAIETCGNIPWKNFQEVIPFTDWIFFDLKQLEAENHKNGTTADNFLILENARRLSKEFNGRLVFRLPLIPGFNDSEENISSIISFIKETGKNEINILPLHHLGREKYQVLQQDYQGNDFSIPTKDNLTKIRDLFLAADIKCYLGSETPF